MDPSSPTKRKPEPVRGFHADIRRALFHSFVEEYPGLDPEPLPNPVAMRRLRFIVWLDGIIQAGAHFHASEIDIRTWEDLAHLKQERNRFEGLITRLATEKAKSQREVESARANARREGGLPPPGGSIFGSQRRR